MTTRANAPGLIPNAMKALRLNPRPVWHAVFAVLLGLLLAATTLLIGRLPIVLLLGLYGAVIGGLISLVIGDIRRWLMGLTFLDIALLLDTYPGNLEQYALAGSITGYVVSLTTGALLVLYISWIVEAISTRREPKRRPVLRVIGPLPIYFAGILLSSLFAKRSQFSGFELFMLVQCLLLMVYIAGSLRTREDVLFLIPFIAAALVIHSAIIFIQRLGYVNPAILYFEAPVGTRPVGALGSPNLAGAFLQFLMVPLVSALFIKTIPNFWKAILVAVLAVSALALVLTSSRGAWLAFALGFGLVFLLAWWRRWISTQVVLSLAAAATVLLLALSPLLISRLTGNDGGAAEARGPLNEIALAMFNYRPITGVGANNFGLELPNYIPPRLGSEWIFIVHNKYLLVLAETGVIGFAGWFAFLLLIVLRGFKLWGMGDRTLSLFGLGLLGAVLGHYTHMAGEIFNARPMVQLLWTYSGVIYAMIRILEEEREAERAQAIAPGL